MPSTYEPIQSYTLGSDQQTITFSSIPQTYTDLVLVMNFGSTADNGSAIRMRINNDNSNLYSTTYLQGLFSGSVPGSAREAGTMAALGYQIGAFTGLKNTYVLHFMEYANTNIYKNYIGRVNGTDGTAINAMCYRSNSAITSLSFRVGNYDSPTASFAANSIFTLHGIKAA
jgi:hypothetical protein